MPVRITLPWIVLVVIGGVCQGPMRRVSSVDLRVSVIPRSKIWTEGSYRLRMVFLQHEALLWRRRLGAILATGREIIVKDATIEASATTLGCVIYLIQ